MRGRREKGNTKSTNEIKKREEKSVRRKKIDGCNKVINKRKKKWRRPQNKYSNARKEFRREN